MRLEKDFLHWKSDLLTEFDPIETGLGRFVNWQKDDFVGRAALAARRDAGPVKRRVLMEVLCTDRVAHGGASLMQDGKVVGTVTSGAWGDRTGMNLAIAFVSPEALDAPMAVDLIGDEIPVRVLDKPPFDPEMTRLRG